jgi:hypothetical protein
MPASSCHLVFRPEAANCCEITALFHPAIPPKGEFYSLSGIAQPAIPFAGRDCAVSGKTGRLADHRHSAGANWNRHKAGGSSFTIIGVLLSVWLA